MTELVHVFRKELNDFIVKYGKCADPSHLFHRFLSKFSLPSPPPDHFVMYGEADFKDSFHYLLWEIRFDTNGENAAGWTCDTDMHKLLQKAYLETISFKKNWWNGQGQKIIQLDVARSRSLENFVLEKAMCPLTMTIKIEKSGKPNRYIILSQGKWFFVVRKVQFRKEVIGASADVLLMEFQGEVRKCDGTEWIAMLFRIRGKGQKGCRMSKDKIHHYMVDLFANILTTNERADRQGPGE